MHTGHLSRIDAVGTLSKDTVTLKDLRYKRDSKSNLTFMAHLKPIIQPIRPETTNASLNNMSTITHSPHPIHKPPQVTNRKFCV